MHIIARTISLTVPTTILIASISTILFLLADESAETKVRALTTVYGLTEMAGIAVVVAVPLSLPTGVLGGVLAAGALKSRRRPSSLSGWIGLGSLCGIVMGCVAVLPFLFGIAAVDDVKALKAILALGFLGSTTGAVVGAMVGLYCSRIARQIVVSVESGV